jgi:hypothetical protein
LRVSISFFSPFKHTHCACSNIAHHPHGIAISLLIKSESGLEIIAESEVEGLSWEITEDICPIPSPQGKSALGLIHAAEAVNYAIVLPVKAARFEHLILFDVISEVLVE